MSYVVFLLLAAGLTIYALVDCWNSSKDEVRGLPRLVWLLTILFLPLIGGLAYLTLGCGRCRQPRLASPRIVAPDDDPEFLRMLDQQRRRTAAEERRREQQQRRDRERKERKEHQEHQSDRDGEDRSGH